MLANLIVLAAEEGGVSEELQLLPEPAELVWGIIAFALLFAFISKFALPALNRMLEERQHAIQGQLTEAERARTEAEGLRRQYEQRLADARNEAAEIIENARKDGERVRADILGRAEDEAAQVTARARDEAEGARARVINELRGQVALASVELAGKIVQRELDPERHRALVDQYINELSGLN